MKTASFRANAHHPAVWTPTKPNGQYLFRDKMLFGRDMPYSGPMKGACFFREFFVGIQYLDAGYEAMVYHRQSDFENPQKHWQKII